LKPPTRSWRNLDDKADRLWRTRSAALRELAQKVRDGRRVVCGEDDGF